MAQKLESGPLQIQHGHTEDQVLIRFPRIVDHILLTPAQADAFILAVRDSLEKLKAHQAGGAGKLAS
jgi:hypothetical protein